MKDEISEAVARAEDRINSDDLETAISDAIADLATLAYEREIGFAEAVVSGVAHALAAYMEGEEPDTADEHLNEMLFPFTGERQLADYIAERAIVRSGQAGKVFIPEWGT
jgi:tRNA threonylcarbamoyladenosine modification (KEOPS) complex Cgi121 subunit